MSSVLIGLVALVALNAGFFGGFLAAALLAANQRRTGGHHGD